MTSTSNHRNIQNEADHHPETITDPHHNTSPTRVRVGRQRGMPPGGMRLDEVKHDIARQHDQSDQRQPVPILQLNYEREPRAGSERHVVERLRGGLLLLQPQQGGIHSHAGRIYIPADVRVGVDCLPHCGLFGGVGGECFGVRRRLQEPFHEDCHQLFHCQLGRR